MFHKFPKCTWTITTRHISLVCRKFLSFLPLCFLLLFHFLLFRFMFGLLLLLLHDFGFGWDNIHTAHFSLRVYYNKIMIFIHISLSFASQLHLTLICKSTTFFFCWYFVQTSLLSFYFYIQDVYFTLFFLLTHRAFLKVNINK